METTLHLTLKKKWFDMIASGVKRETKQETKAAAEPPLDCRVMPDASDYREGVNIERLQRAMRALGLTTEDSQDAFAAVMADNINRLTTSVIRSVLTRHNAS